MEKILLKIDQSKLLDVSAAGPVLVLVLVAQLVLVAHVVLVYLVFVPMAHLNPYMFLDCLDFYGHSVSTKVTLFSSCIICRYIYNNKF